MPRSARLLAWLFLSGLWLWAAGWLSFADRPNCEALIHGTVVADGMPVAGAVVRVAGDSHAVLSDENGAFALPRPAALNATKVAASKPDYFIAGADVGERRLSIELRRHPRGDNPDYAWVDPRPDANDAARCANCHREIFDEWQTSSHASSATNRRFLNVVDGADWHGNPDVGWNLVKELPAGAGVCHSCHFPSSAPPVTLSTGEHPTTGVHSQGIHCDLCHKIVDVAIDQVGLDHGRFALSFVRPHDEHQIFFGPLDDVARGDDVYLPIYRESRYCASCHEGILFGTHVYGTFSEWLASPQARQGLPCQDCHMAPTGRMTNFAPGHGGLDRDPASLASHRFPGADTGFLRDHLSLSLTSRETDPGIEVEAVVRVHAVGHRVPTGSPTRALILHVEAVSEDGKPLELSDGTTLPALAGEGAFEAGGLAGRPGIFFAKVLEGPDGEQGAPFWRSARVAYDTRLEPDEVRRSRFIFRSTGARSQVNARLLYRRFAKHVADEKGWPGNELTICSESCETQPRIEQQKFQTVNAQALLNGVLTQRTVK